MHRLTLLWFLLSGLFFIALAACGGGNESASPTEAELLAKAEHSLTAHLNKDWNTFLESCASESRTSRNIDNLEEEHRRKLLGSKPEDVSFSGFTTVPNFPDGKRVLFDVYISGRYIGQERLSWKVENGQWVNTDCLLGHQ